MALIPPTPPIPPMPGVGWALAGRLIKPVRNATAIMMERAFIFLSS
jgi:hypothetical protein